MSNSIKYFLFLLALVPLSVLAKDECHTFVKNLPSKRNDPAAPFSLYYKSSGLQGRLDLGNKTLCELDDTMRYYVIHDINGAYGTKGWRQAETGICVPSYCEKEMLQNDKDLMKKLAQVNNWPVGDNIALHDPNHNDYRGPLYYALINLFYGLVGLCIASTVIQCITRFAENRKSQGPVKKDYSVWLFKSFDVVGNLKSLWQTAEESGQSDHLSMFGFVRLLAIIWVISFHCRDRNLEMWRYPGGVSTHPQTDRLIGMGDIAPGYFFFMGGFLAVYTIAGKAARSTGSGLVGYIMDIVHRFFKIYPGACVAILMYWIVMPGLINGPLWTRYIGAIQVCEERWRDKFLLKDNWVFQPFDHCASWTWYIDVDFQVYPVVAFLAYVFIQHRFLKYGVYVALIWMIHYSFYLGLNTIHEVERTGRNPKEVWYQNQYIRAYEILIGAFFGFQYYEYAKLKLKSNLVSMWERYADFRYVCIVAGAYINYWTFFTDAPLSGWTANEWEYTKRLYLSIGTALLFVPLANDSASILKAIMNLRIFQILGKLCFGAYLLHWPLLLAANYTVEKIPDRYDHMVLREKICENLILSFAAAFVYYLTLEKPLLNIEAHFSKRGGGEKKPVNYVTVDLDVQKNLVGYKMLNEDLDESAMPEQDYSVMEASIIEDHPKRMEISSPVSPGQSTRGGNSSFLTSKKSVRSYQQFDNQSMRDGGDIEMGKYEDRDENNKSKYSMVSAGHSPTSTSHKN